MQWKTRGRRRCSPLSLPPGDCEANRKNLWKLSCRTKTIKEERGFEEEDGEEERWHVESLDESSSVSAVTNVFSPAAVTAVAALCLLHHFAARDSFS